MFKILSKPPEKGFSLVEVMIAMTISLIMTFVILQMFTNYETNNRITSSGIDAQQNGQIAAYILEQEIRLAGYGLAVDELQDCATYYDYYDEAGGTGNSPITTFSTTAVTITDGGANPDQILVRYGNSLRGHEPVALDTNFSATDDALSVDSVFGFSAGELILIVNAAGDCTLRQLTAIDTVNTNIEADVGTAPYNAPSALITATPVWPPAMLSATTSTHWAGWLSAITRSADLR